MTLAFTRAWILISTFLVATGWVLSSIHQLNRVGYAVALTGGLFWAIVHLRGRRFPRRRFRRWRFRKWLPLAFATLAGLVVLSGFLYAPNNYDALSYRVPRTLHWLAAGQWHWIHTSFARMNTRASDCEWIMAPLLLFARSERWLWVANAAMFAALPGLIFTTFTLADVSRKVAWHWMWILPTGYVFVLQAGGISNDLPAAFFALAAVGLALRASRRGATGDLWLSLLAVALSQGVKASNAPLALVWFAAAMPALKIALGTAFRAAAVGLVAALVSFLPNAVLNATNCGDWSGAKLELGEKIKAPSWVLASGNAVAIVAQNFTPPIFPMARRWNAAASAHFPQTYKNRLVAAFESGEPWSVEDMQIEDTATLGLGVSVLLAIATVFALFAGIKSRRRSSRWLLAVRWTPWIALLVFMAKVGLSAAGRLIAPYYLLVPMPILAAGGQMNMLHSWWWRVPAAAQIASAAVMLTLLPSRPLWPALTVIRQLAIKRPNSTLIQRMQTVYATYRIRPDALAPVREALPAEVHTAGLVAADDLETSLWRPFGTRKYLHVLNEDSRRALDAEHVQFIVINPVAFASQIRRPFGEWLNDLDGELVRTVTATSRASQGPVEWKLVRLHPHDTANRSAP